MKRKEYFYFIRDIPYRTPIKFEKNNYSCHGKHTILKKLLEKTKAEVRFRICEFYWDDFNIIPGDIKKISHSDKGIHVYLQVKNKHGWVNLDATLDNALSPHFLVNEWDGQCNTMICVRPRLIYSPEKSLEIYNNYDYGKDLEFNHDFYKALNSFFESIRVKNQA